MSFDGWGGIDDDIAFFRAAEAELMDTTGRLLRPDGSPTFDPDTGTLSDPRTEIYSGPALVRSNMWQGSDIQLGQEEARIRTVRIKLPADTAAQRGDVFVVDSSTHDARLVDREFTVTDVLVDEWQISSTLIAEEVSR